MALRQISEHVYADTEVGGGNSGAILSDDGIVVVDAAFARSARTFRASVEKMSPKKIKHLVLTHSHSDHVFGNEVYTDCEIVAHESLKTRMQELASTDWTKENLQRQVADLEKTNPQMAEQFKDVHIVLPTRTFTDTLVLGEGQFRVEVIHTGGHTADSCIVHFPQEAIVFAGDLIFAGIYPFGGDPSADPDVWVEALNLIRNMQPKFIVPGHGPVCNVEEVDSYINYISNTKSVVIKLLSENKSEDDVVTDPALPQFDGHKGQFEVEFRTSSLTHWYQVWKQRTGNQKR